jgi:ABC-type nitrate/sulfonate/bicarbonate transport system substrate-binding protein
MKAVFLAVSLLLLLSFSVASAQPTKVIVGYSAIAAGHFPAWMAKEAGIFRKNGLDVQLVYFRGGTPAMMALLSRETPISQLGGPAIVSANLRGGRCRAHRRRACVDGMVAHDSAGYQNR